MMNLDSLLALPETRWNHKPFDVQKALNQYRVDPSVTIEKPRVILSCQGAPVATIGNCSLIIGKAKTKKTFLITCLASAAICGRSSIGCISGDHSDLDVILIDTEQSPYHLQRTVDRIIRQVGQIPENFKAYGLRPLTASQRVEVIDSIINNLEGYALIIIDGLRDLLSRGINDESEATELMSKILRWTYGKDCHIMLVLHQNKADQNARGHAGTEAVNKSETTLSVQRDEKNRDLSIVTAEYSRDIDFPPFRFTIGEDGLPYQADTTETTQDTKLTQITENFQHILPGMRSMKYQELCQEYVEISGASVPTAKRHISTGVKIGILKKDNSGTYRMINNETSPF